jgi:hypothetical protein
MAGTRCVADCVRPTEAFALNNGIGSDKGIVANRCAVESTLIAGTPCESEPSPQASPSATDIPDLRAWHLSAVSFSPRIAAGAGVVSASQFAARPGSRAARSPWPTGRQTNLPPAHHRPARSSRRHPARPQLAAQGFGRRGCDACPGRWCTVRGGKLACVRVVGPVSADWEVSLVPAAGQFDG